MFFVWWQHQVLSLAVCHWHRQREIIVPLCCCCCLCVSGGKARGCECSGTGWENPPSPPGGTPSPPTTPSWPSLTTPWATSANPSPRSATYVDSLTLKVWHSQEEEKTHFSWLSAQRWRFSFIVSNISRISWVIQVEACPQLPSSQKNNSMVRIIVWSHESSHRKDLLEDGIGHHSPVILS